MLPHPSLPDGIGCHVSAIVIKQVSRYLALAGLGEMSKLLGPSVGIVSIHIRTGAEMSQLCSLVGKKVRYDLIFVSGSILPVSLPFVPRLGRGHPRWRPHFG